jgi:2-iminobutanoate/2-iminopropanoate deaminase
MPKKIALKSIHAKDFLNEPIEYQKSFSRGIKLECGDTFLIFISGTASVNEKGETHAPGDFLAQAKRTFQNITALLASENVTWQNVVKTTCYLKDMVYYPPFNDYRNEFYKEQGLNPFPASTCVQAELCRKELLVEIDVIAAIKKDQNLL